VLTIQADEFYYGGRTYFRRWNRLRRYSGGLWITKASHDFDMLYWLAGALPLHVSADAHLTHYVPKPEAGKRCSACPIEPQCPDSHLRDMKNASALRLQLQAIREAAGWPPADLCLYNSDKDTFDHGMAQVAFAKDTLGTYTCNVVAPFTDRRLRVGGTEGTLDGSLSSPELLYWRRHEADDPHQAARIPLQEGEVRPGGHGGADAYLLDDFAALVRREAPQPISPAEASVAIALGLAATKSSDTQTTVKLEEVAGWKELCSYL
jgi:predicted dehydrogenase